MRQSTSLPLQAARPHRQPGAGQIVRPVSVSSWSVVFRQFRWRDPSVRIARLPSTSVETDGLVSRPWATLTVILVLKWRHYHRSDVGSVLGGVSRGKRLDVAAAARCDGVSRARPRPATSFVRRDGAGLRLGPAESVHDVATQEVHVHLHAEPGLRGHLQPAIAVVEGRSDEVVIVGQIPARCLQPVEIRR